MHGTLGFHILLHNLCSKHLQPLKVPARRILKQNFFSDLLAAFPTVQLKLFICQNDFTCFEHESFNFNYKHNLKPRLHVRVIACTDDAIFLKIVASPAHGKNRTG